MKGCLRLFLIAVVAATLSVPIWAQLTIPEISYDAVENLKGFPDDVYLGEIAGVATNSKGHIFVYTRTGHVTVTEGTSRAFVHGGAHLYEFDQTGKYLREIGQGVYGFVWAHTVHVDPQDNIWIVDEGSNMIMKFDPDGRVLMTLGRHPEATPIPQPRTLAPVPTRPAGPGGGAAAEGGGRPSALPGAGVPGDNFDWPDDVAWDPQGNIFIADGDHDNQRVAKFDKDGKFIKSWGSLGTAPGQFHTVHSLQVDAKGMVYVADRSNNRIQVFDNDGNFKTQYMNVGTPGTLCITSGPHQYLYSANFNFPENFEEGGEIYKMELDGKVLGRFGKAGHQVREFGSVHAIDCRNPNELIVGDLTNWRVQKITLHPTAAQGPS
jgi:DNA-binding beta-propeller fold protein YncE